LSSPLRAPGGPNLSRPEAASRGPGGG
jgi:hypothetical protein